jgi:hypothetical protein
VTLCNLLQFAHAQVSEQEKANLLAHRKEFNVFDRTLHNHLIRLRFDSIKVFCFNRDKDEIEDFSTVVNDSSIYNLKTIDTINQMIRGTKKLDEGTLISEKDCGQLMKVMKRLNKDFYGIDDPVGIYAPSLGFVFFKFGKPCAHLDVALAYDKLQLEVSNNNNTVYRYKLDVLGKKSDEFFRYIVTKYNLPIWVLTP